MFSLTVDCTTASQSQSIGVARGNGGGGGGALNWNATNEKKVTKRLLFLQFLLASTGLRVQQYSRTTVISNNIDPLGPGPPQFNFYYPI